MAIGVEKVATINIVFFASLKESMGMSEYQVELAEPIRIVDLKQRLSEELEQGELLLAQGLQASIDYEFARDNDVVDITAKEVAFFPPVTGG